MASPGEGLRVLLAGESSVALSHEQWGFSALTVGSYHEGDGPLRTALESGGVDYHHVPNHLAVNEFPWTPEELSAYDVVILSDIAADTLLLHGDAFYRNLRTVNRLQSLVEYVEGGGGLAMIGGYMSFSGLGGKACYHLSPLADVLPVRMLGYDDRVETPQGVVPKVENSDHPIVQGLGPEWPPLLGYNKVVHEGRGELLLSSGRDPLLVVDSVGTGRVAAFTSDCVGHWGGRDFMDWEHYAAFWRQLVAWLGGARESVRSGAPTSADGNHR